MAVQGLHVDLLSPPTSQISEDQSQSLAPLLRWRAEPSLSRDSGEGSAKHLALYFSRLLSPESLTSSFHLNSSLLQQAETDFRGFSSPAAGVGR